MNKALQTGDIGEHLCAVWLLEIGVSCKIVNVDCTDILATVDDAFIRIQVKSSNYNTRTDAIKPTPFYNFSTGLGFKKEVITSKHCDIIALVALDIKRIMFKLPKLKQTTRLRRPDFASPTLEKDTWDACIKKIRCI